MNHTNEQRLDQLRTDLAAAKRLIDQLTVVCEECGGSGVLSGSGCADGGCSPDCGRPCLACIAGRIPRNAARLAAAEACVEFIRENIDSRRVGTKGLVAAYDEADRKEKAATPAEPATANGGVPSERHS